MIIEILRFRLRPDADQAAFVAADASLQSTFAYQQPGLLRRTTAQNADGEWVVIDLWRAVQDADACAAIWEGDPVAAAFMAHVDSPTVHVERFATLE